LLIGEKKKYAMKKNPTFENEGSEKMATLISKNKREK